MVHGQNRAKIKALAHKLGDFSLDAGHGVGNAMQSLFQDVVIHPTTRVVDFIGGSSHGVLRDIDEAFKAKKKAARGGGHHRVIFAKPLFYEGSFVAPNYPKNKIDAALIDGALANNFVFDHLSKSKRLDLVGAFEPIVVKKGTNIIEEGDTGDYFYVVGAGDVDCFIDGNRVGSVEQGGSFGELALLYDAPRAATCVARSQCGLFRLDQGTFKRILAQQIQESQREVMNVLKSVPFFQDLDGKYLDMIACNLRVVNFNDGDVLVSKDSPIRFYIIKEGRVDVMNILAGGAHFNDAKDMGPGFFFGELAVTQGKYFMDSVIARGPVVAMVLEREDFIKVVGNDMGSLIKKTLDKKKLVSNGLFQSSYCCLVDSHPAPNRRVTYPPENHPIREREKPGERQRTQLACRSRQRHNV
jgi:cAMP-dependent protein kinase regulator